MQFIYLGEATFYEEKMNEFLSVARSLEIKELCNAATETNDDHRSSPSDSDNREEQTIRSSQEEYYEEGKSESDNKFIIQQVRSLETKELCNSETETNDNIFSLSHPEPSTNNSFEQNMRSSHLMSNAIKDNMDGREVVTVIDKYDCGQCDKTFTKIGNLKTHRQKVHEDVMLVYSCDVCDYQASQQSNLIKHIKSKHQDVKYDCDQCDSQFTQREVLKGHIESTHEIIYL